MTTIPDEYDVIDSRLFQRLTEYDAIKELEQIGYDAILSFLKGTTSMTYEQAAKRYQTWCEKNNITPEQPCSETSKLIGGVWLLKNEHGDIATVTPGLMVLLPVD